MQNPEPTNVPAVPTSASRRWRPTLFAGMTGVLMLEILFSAGAIFPLVDYGDKLLADPTTERVVVTVKKSRAGAWRYLGNAHVASFRTGSGETVSASLDARRWEELRPGEGTVAHVKRSHFNGRVLSVEPLAKTREGLGI